MAQQIKKKFIGNDQVDGDKISLLHGQSIKIQDASGVESDLIKLGPSGEVLVGASGYEAADKAALDQEIADRIAGDASTLASAQAYAESYTDTEIDAFIAGPFAGEIADRQSGDASTLASSQAYTDQEVLAEETARIAEDANLQSQITGNYNTLDAYISSVEDALAQEVVDRTAADSNLQSQIDAISGGGSGSISALQIELDATQVGVGLNPDGSYSAPGFSNYLSGSLSVMGAVQALDVQAKVIADDLTQEIADRIAADNGLQSQIDNVLSNVDPGALDSLTEVVSAFQAADASLNGAITALSTGLSADIDAEEQARIAADAALQGEIDAEEIARAAADVTLQNNIDAEQSARISADNAIDGRLDILEGRLWVKEKFSISNGQTSVTLSFAPLANSMSAWVDRLAIHEGSGEDFTILGTTMTFVNDLVSPGQSQLGNGDTVYVKYQKAP